MHNRLGFELHYRAEKSTGAQTSISRPELRKIISEIVHSLQEDEIESTINLLDEATTERLVLVNTPEDGNSVRFDIRPLQEFFAAEYLYESAIEGGFLERLRAIASDSHWREVLHFLISALVEQSRRGELAQAIEVLSELDDNPPDQRRSFARRLCIGGIISIRLLSEGVIESDKRTRTSFRKCIRSLLASTDAGSLLFSSPPPHSASWLATVALDAIAEEVHSENIGAACILPLTLTETSENIERAIANLESCDKSYLDAFIDYRWMIDHVDEEGGPPIWVFIALLKRVLAQNWRDLGGDTLYKIYNVFASNPKKLCEAATAYGMSQEHAVNLFRFFTIDLYIEKMPSDKEVSVVGGVLIKFTKKRKSDFGSLVTDQKLFKKFSQLGGVVHACYLLAITTLQPTSERYDRLEEIFGGAQGLRLLPSQVRTELLELNVNRLPERKISELIKRGDLDTFDYEIVRDFEGEIKWEEVLSELPEFCYNLLGTNGIDKLTASLEKWLEDTDNRRKFLEKIEVSELYVPLWLGDLGEIIAKLPESCDKIKRLYARSRTVNSGMYFHDRGKTFDFVLPDDSDLLPHLVAHLAGSQRHLYGTPRFEHTSEISFLSYAKRYLPDFSKVDQVWQDAKHSREVVAAAGALLLLDLPSSTSDEDLREFFGRLLSLYDQEYSSWFMPGVLKFLTPAIKSGSAAALDFADQLLGKARADLVGRKASEDVIASWREISHAPVHATLSSGIWLSQS